MLLLVVATELARLEMVGLVVLVAVVLAPAKPVGQEPPIRVTLAVLAALVLTLVMVLVVAVLVHWVVTAGLLRAVMVVLVFLRP